MLPCGTPQRRGRGASLTPSRYILLVESGLIDMTKSVLWPNRERRKLSVLLVIN